MRRFKGRVLWTFAALAIGVTMAQVAEAQREGGRRGRGGRGFIGRLVPAVQLVVESDDVQVAVNVTPEQKVKLEEINDQLREDRRAAFQQDGRNFREAQGEIEKLNQAASGKLAEALDEGQQKRLAGISIQVNGAAALREPLVAKELNITDEQNTKLTEARDSNMRSAMESFRNLRDQELSREERRAKEQEIRDTANKNLLAALTSEQQAQFESLKGEPVDVDMSDFRGGRGRDGGGRRGDRERQRNRPARDNDQSDADST